MSKSSLKQSMLAMKGIRKPPAAPQAVDLDDPALQRWLGAGVADEPPAAEAVAAPMAHLTVVATEPEEDSAHATAPQAIPEPARPKRGRPAVHGERRALMLYLGPQRAQQLQLRAVEQARTMNEILVSLIDGFVQAPNKRLPSAAKLREDAEATEAARALVQRADGARRRVTINISPETHRAFKLESVRLGRDMSDIVDALVARWLA